MMILACWTGLVIGNVLYSSIRHDWEQAWDRSFFQGTALLAYWITSVFVA